LLWLDQSHPLLAAGLGRLCRKEEEEMSRKTAFRGIPSLILVLVFGLTLAGPSPAAAADLGFREFSLERLASGFWGEVAGWFTGADKRGFGIDPNGQPILIDPDPENPTAPSAPAAPPAPPDHPGPSAQHGRP
jgi:hypothetical protein